MLLQKVPKRDVGRVFKDKIWSMDRKYTIKHRSCSWKGKDSRRKGHMLLQIEKVAETSSNTFIILSFNSFIYFSLPLCAASWLLGSFVTFCGMLSIVVCCGIWYVSKSLGSNVITDFTGYFHLTHSDMITFVACISFSWSSINTLYTV